MQIALDDMNAFCIYSVMESRLKSLRERMGWKQNEMARILRVDPSRVSRMEKRDRLDGPVEVVLDVLDAILPQPESPAIPPVLPT